MLTGAMHYYLAGSDLITEVVEAIDTLRDRASYIVEFVGWQVPPPCRDGYDHCWLIEGMLTGADGYYAVYRRVEEPSS